MRRARLGFNLVELLITLSIVALLTTMVVNAVTDYKDKVRMVRVKNDLMLIAEMCKYVEATEKTLIVTLSETGTEVASDISNYIIKLPSEDPWGRRFQTSTKGTVTVTSGLGFAYIIDRGMGRVISPGPDGVCDTQLGFGRSDVERDIVVEFRSTQWLAYNVTNAAFPAGGIWMARGDGSVPPIKIADGWNMQVTADRRKFCCMQAGGLQWGMLDRVTVLKTPSALPDPLPVPVPKELYPFWAPDGVHIIVVSGGNIYAVNSESGACRNLTKGMGPLTPIDEAPYKAKAFYFDNDGNRTFFNDGQCSYFHHASTDGNAADIFVTVSLDGKIAFFNRNHCGIDSMLLDGTGYRVVKKGDGPPPGGSSWFRPLYWMSSEVLVYLDKLHKYIGRIKQDGSYDIRLWPQLQGTTMVPVPPGLAAEGLAPMMSIAPSPDRSLFLVFSKQGSGNQWYRLAKTDGSGCVPNWTEFEINAHPPQDATPAVPLWDRSQKRIFIPGRPAGALTSSGNICVMQLEDKNGSLRYQQIAVNTDNEYPAAVAYAWDIDRSSNLLAVVSAAPGIPGVYVYPACGPDGATTRISPQGPDAACQVGSIFWLK